MHLTKNCDFKMNREQLISAEQTGPSTSAGAWGLRYPGLIMGKGGKNEVKEFTGMWRLNLCSVASWGHNTEMHIGRGSQGASSSSSCSSSNPGKWGIALTPYPGLKRLGYSV
jgi:hypothetical protein